MDQINRDQALEVLVDHHKDKDQAQEVLADHLKDKDHLASQDLQVQVVKIEVLHQVIHQLEETQAQDKMRLLNNRDKVLHHKVVLHLKAIQDNAHLHNRTIYSEIQIH